MEALGFRSVIERIDLVEEDGADFTGFQVGEEGEEVFSRAWRRWLAGVMKRVSP